MKTKGLAVVSPPDKRQQQPKEVKSGESEAVQVLDDSMFRTVAPLSDYSPLTDEVRAKTSDQICFELATECDRLRFLIEDAYTDPRGKPGETAAIITRRLGGLKLLSERLDEVAGREEVKIELATISSVVSTVREVLRETGVSPETREIVFQKLLSRISAQREAEAG